MDNRELKFRQPIFYIPTNAFARFHYWGYDKGTFISPLMDARFPRFQGAASQQYIGVADKYKVDIYVGDIVQYVNNSSNGYSGKHRPKVVERLMSRTRNGFNITDGSNYQIIGNCFDSPELIKK